MTTTTTAPPASSEAWSDKNQRYLVDCIAVVKLHLQRHADEAGSTTPPPVQPAWPKEEGNAPPSLEIIRQLFGLSDFEWSILVLCAGAELDSEVGQLCAKVQGASYPTFGLALGALPNPHWSALVPISPLRRFRLVEIAAAGQLPSSLTASPLRIEERVLHYLAGISYLEKQLQGIIRPVTVRAMLPESHMHLVSSILLSINGRNEKKPATFLWGADSTSKLVAAARVCNELGLLLWQVEADALPQKADELDAFVQLWIRESALLGAGLYISADDADAQAQKLARRLADEMPGIVFVGTRERIPSSSLSLEVKKPEKGEQLAMWKAYLGELVHGLSDGELARITSQFDLNSASIQQAASEALFSFKNASLSHSSFSSALWQSSRVASRPKMSDLAQHIEPKAKMEDLVLPEREKQLIKEIAIQVRQRDRVYREWGWGANSGSRGLGIAALFAGESGTGKTMAAEVLANELDLDLFRIDLSMVVSKYIGETEKNLRQVFDAAEDGGAILFFDEADALFGKRSEVRDSHDRYANIEVGYLLQRMESYRGLAILTTNLKNAIDTAFVRRIRFIVNFPFPDEKSRADIWRRVFPKSTPTANLDYGRLARMNITGGSIRNIALNACFLAAEQDVHVGMDHIKQAAKSEYDKMERPLTRLEMGD